ncbi:NUDIX domain-containing protein [Alkalicoccus luteus]|uniref:8-oxo-dGTP diphosphatase n=1 Tax=Alkalicoccus luteus TaxID=1237094 RepID=A0A969TT03_9BACI|nr:8-oxo-dGTP diphosphatase [Alkalicoccus luteus]NJP37133.1 8-oxo-dGTP diphosphatase [Alkalicoccus luteus]
MQRITNCMIEYEGRLLMIKKPKRGWWYVPGGKMEHEELAPEAAAREVYEETGLTIRRPELRGILTHLVTDGESYMEKRTMFLFYAKGFSGTLRSRSPEGELDWIPVSGLDDIPMDEADRKAVSAVLNEPGILYGTLIYNHHRELQETVFELNGRRL